jgi:hypothetical protein
MDCWMIGFMRSKTQHFSDSITPSIQLSANHSLFHYNTSVAYIFYAAAIRSQVTGDFFSPF